MGIFKSALIVVLTAIAVKFLPESLGPKHPIRVFGNVEPQFQKVKEVFKTNFIQGWERAGAAFAVYHQGRLVVDLWGGYADKDIGRPWKEDTMTVAFSTTKSLYALCGAMLVDRGQLDYDALVTKYWKEFGQNGKANVTVKMLLSHQAGLAGIDEPITLKDVESDWEELGRKLAKQKPNWPPGKAAGYHAFTYSFVVDQLVRRVDSDGRSCAQFLRQEVLEPNEIDLFVGMPMSEFWRVARYEPPGLLDRLVQLADLATIKLILKLLTGPSDSLISKIMNNPGWLNEGLDSGGWNDPDILKLEVGSGNGVGTARAFAKVFSLFIQGKLVKNSKNLDRIFNPIFHNEVELAMGMNITAGWGFWHQKSPKGGWSVGHPGYGGQNVKADLGAGLAFAYLTNGLTTEMSDDAWNFAKLRTALYECLQ